MPAVLYKCPYCGMKQNIRIKKFEGEFKKTDFPYPHKCSEFTLKVILFPHSLTEVGTVATEYYRPIDISKLTVSPGLNLEYRKTSEGIFPFLRNIPTSITTADYKAGPLFVFNPETHSLIDSFHSYSAFYNSKFGKHFFLEHPQLTLEQFINDVNIYPEGTDSYGFAWRRYPLRNPPQTLPAFDKAMKEHWALYPCKTQKETSMHSYSYKA